MTRPLAFLTLTLSLTTSLWAEPVESVKARYESQRQELSQELRLEKIELMKLISVDSPDQESIKKKLNQILETERQRQHLFVEEMFAVKGAMTDQQWRDYRRAIILMMMSKEQKQ